VRIKSNRRGQGSFIRLLSVILLSCISAILFASSFRAAPGKSQQEAQLIRTPTRAASTPAPHATTLIVTTTADSGPGSLRDTIAAASNGDTIQFDPALNGQIITLTTGQLTIDKDLTITGPGAGLLAVSRSQGASPDSIFHLLSGAVAVEGLTISNGDGGGGILNDGANLTINNCTISGNAGLAGGGICSNAGALRIVNSTIDSNRSGQGSTGGFGGGIGIHGGSLELIKSMVTNNGSISLGGGIAGNGGTMTITDSTISGNAGVEGGGVYGDATIINNSTISGNSGFDGGGGIYGGGGRITNSTISGNTAQEGGGIYATSPLDIGNTILNAGTSGANIVINGGTVVTSLGYNLSSDDGGGFLTGPGDQINTDPMLGSLQNNGGPTFTHELLLGSPAINTGDPNFTPPPEFDQRGAGFPRVYDGRIDIGSFEVQSVQPTPTPTPTSTPIPTPTPTPTATATPTSTPTPTATGTPPPTASPTPSPSPMPAAQAINLSTRMRVQTGDNVGIGGFIVTGTAPKHVLLRAIGPSLTGFGVPDALADPVLELHGPAFATITNDNWRDDPVQEAAILADGIPPSNDLESAIDATLNPGAYTAIVRGNGNTSGVALVEVYDLNQSVDSKLANISTRAFVSTGDSIVIAGFTLGDSSGDDRIVVRGIGPSLTSTGVPNALADPTLELRNSNGTLLTSDDNWQDNAGQAAEISAAGLAPSNAMESAIAATLSPGAYTVLLAGLNNGTGVGLVEVYDRGAP
jgi:hypothetical protein